MQKSPAITATGPASVQEAAKTYDGAIDRYFAALDEQRAATAGLRDAKTKRAADVRAAAERGTALPSTKEIEKAEQRLTDARERAKECENFAMRKLQALGRAIADAAPEWRSQLATIRAAAVARHDAAAAEYLEAVQGIAEVLALGLWIDRTEARVREASNDNRAASFPAPESVLTHRDPSRSVEVFGEWVRSDFAEPIRPRDGRAKPDAA